MENEITEPINVLLPVCVEMEFDVFLYILQCVVQRTRMDDNQVDALMYGMSSESIYVKLNDLTVNWNELQSRSQRIRQLKLLGFWAIHHYPILGKKLFRERWQPPERKTIEVLGGPEMSADVIDDTICRKMELRIIQLNVPQSTLKKLKYFVVAPASIGKFDESQISSKIKTFHIETDQLETCWQALKLGKFDESIAFTEPERHVVFTNEQQGAVGKGIANRIDTNSHPVSADLQMVPVVKRMRLDITTTRAEEQIIDRSSGTTYADEPPNVKTTDECTFSTLQSSISEMQRGIATLTKWLDPTAKGGNDIVFRSTQLDVQILTQKDAEISLMKSELNEVKTNAANDRSNLESRIHELGSQLSESDRAKTFITEANEKLQAQLNEEKINAANDRSHLESQIHKLGTQLSESDRVKTFITEAKERLEGELNVVRCANSDQLYLERRIHELEKQLYEANEVKIGMANENGKLDSQLNDLKAKLKDNEKLRQDMQIFTNRSNSMLSQVQTQFEDAYKKSEETAMNNNKLAIENIKLQEELNTVKQNATANEKALNIEIDRLKTSAIVLKIATKVDIGMQTEAGEVNSYNEREHDRNNHKSASIGSANSDLEPFCETTPVRRSQPNRQRLPPKKLR